jgi:hypothetical protein
MELIRIIREHRDGVDARPAGTRLALLWRRMRRTVGAASAPTAPAPAPCDGAHAQA